MQGVGQLNYKTLAIKGKIRAHGRKRTISPEIARCCFMSPTFIYPTDHRVHVAGDLHIGADQILVSANRLHRRRDPIKPRLIRQVIRIRIDLEQCKPYRAEAICRNSVSRKRITDGRCWVERIRLAAMWIVRQWISEQSTKIPKLRIEEQRCVCSNVNVVYAVDGP